MVEFVVRCEEEARVVRVLCFGDSLTFGLTSSFGCLQTRTHPYTTKLQEYFNLEHSRTSQQVTQSAYPLVQLYNAGVSGEQVQKEMLPRLTGILQEATPKYNWVLILGGTNDLCRMKSIREQEWKGQDTNSIFNAIAELHGISHKWGAKSVAMTIPSLQCEEACQCPQMKDVRLKVNDMIRNYAASSSGKVILADLDAKLSHDHLLTCDGVHLTATAYDEMAGIIFDSMKKYA